MVYAWSVTAYHAVPSLEFMIGSSCEVTFPRTPFSIHAKEGEKQDWAEEEVKLQYCSGEVNHRGNSNMN